MAKIYPNLLIIVINLLMDKYDFLLIYILIINGDLLWWLISILINLTSDKVIYEKQNRN